MLWIVLGLIVLAVFVIIGTGRGRDLLALRMGHRIVVDQITGAPAASADGLYAYRVRVSTTGGPEKYVLAPSQDAAGSAALDRDGAAEVDCLLGPYRVVRDASGWSVAVLPTWLSWIGQRCEHGGNHLAGGTTRKATAVESLLSTRASVPTERIFAALLESEVVMVNLEVVQGDGVPRIRLPVVALNGRDVIPVFTSESYVPSEPGLRLSRHPFRLLLEVMRPPRAPVIINPRSAIEYALEVDAITSLQNTMATTPAP